MECFQFRGATFKDVFVEDGLIGYEININLDTIPVYSDIVYTQEIIHNKDYQNHYRLFEIPLLIGYQKNLGEWSLGIHAGVYTNIALQTSGMIFTPDVDFAFIDTEQSDYFQSNIGLSYYIGGEGKYLINDKLSLSFSPHLRIFPKSFTNNDHGIDQKYTIAGLNLGIDFRF